MLPEVKLWSYVSRVGTTSSVPRTPLLSEATNNCCLSTEMERNIFCEGWGRGRGWDAYLFSKFDKWRRGVRIKFEAETIVSSMCHDDWFMNLGKGRDV